MKITKSYLEQIIVEEYQKVILEQQSQRPLTPGEEALIGDGTFNPLGPMQPVGRGEDQSDGMGQILQGTYVAPEQKAAAGQQQSLGNPGLDALVRDGTFVSQGQQAAAAKAGKRSPASAQKNALINVRKKLGTLLSQIDAALSKI